MQNAKRELLNTPRTHALVNELASEGVKIARGSHKFIGYIDGDEVFTATKASFGFVCLLSDRIILNSHKEPLVSA